MALKIGDNFSYQGKKPNFDRDNFDTLAAMKAYPETSIDEGHISYCKEDGKNYQYKSANSVNATTGKWREFKSGDSYPAGGTAGQVLKKTSTGVEWGTDNDTKYTPATKSTNGLMSSDDKTKIDNLFNILSGGVDGQVLKKSGQTIDWRADKDTKYNPATTTENGLLSKEDKAKLDSIVSMTVLTQNEYDELETKDANVIYIIKG